MTAAKTQTKPSAADEALANAAVLAESEKPAAVEVPNYVGKKLKLVAVHGDLQHLLVPGKTFTVDRPLNFVVDQFVQNQIEAGKLVQYVESDE